MESSQNSLTRMLADPEYQQAFDEHCAELSKQLSIANQRMLAVSIFADKQIQGIFNHYVNISKETIIGTYTKGVRAYILGKDNNPHGNVSPIRNETMKEYRERMKSWELGYKDASTQVEFQTLRALCTIIREAD